MTPTRSGAPRAGAAIMTTVRRLRWGGFGLVAVGIVLVGLAGASWALLYAPLIAVAFALVGVVQVALGVTLVCKAARGEYVGAPEDPG